MPLDRNLERQQVQAEAERTPTSLGNQALAGFVAGALESPLVGDLLQLSAVEAGVSPAQLEAAMDAASHSTLSEIVSLGTNIATSLITGGAAISAGRSLAVGGLRTLAAGRTAGRLGAVAQRAGQLVPGAGPAAPPGALEVGTRIAGGNLALGALTGVEQLAEGEELPDALQTAALVAGLGATFETGLTQLHRLPGLGGLRPARLDQGDLRAGSEAFRRRLRSIRPEIEQQRQRIERVLAVDDQTRELVAFVPPSVQRPLLRQIPGAPRITETTRREVLDLRQGLRELRTEQSSLRQFLRTPVIQDLMMRGRTLNPSDESLAIHEMLTQVAKAPETTLRQLGVTGTKAFQLLRQAEIETVGVHGPTRAHLTRMKDEAARLMGVSRRASRRGDFFQPAVDAYERGGLEGVRQFNSRLVPMFRDLERRLLRGALDRGDIQRPGFRQAAQLGGRRPLRDSELQEMGVRAFFPQVVDWSQVTRDQMMSRYARHLQRTRRIGRERALEEATRVMANTTEGLKKFGSIDFQRNLSGTTLAKIRAGLPLVRDPFQALEQYLIGVQRRVSYGTRFGFNGEMQATLVASMQREAARQATRRTGSSGVNSAALLNSTLGVALGRDFYSGSMRRWAENVVNFQIAAKLTLAAIPNISQSINSILTFGLRNTTRGLVRSIRERATPRARRVSLAELNGIVGSATSSAREVWLEPASATISGRIANHAMRWSGFGITERMNRVIGANTGLYSFQRDLSRAVAGRLRGPTLERARRRVAQQGFDLDDLVRRARRFDGTHGQQIQQALAELERNGTGVLQQVAWNSIILTQFPPVPSRRPLFWNSPTGRVIFQFKTFAFNQAKLVRDAVLKEASQGNVKPLATMLSLYPVAGEMVGSTRGLISGKERPDDALMRYVDNFLWVGGMGIVTDMVTAAQYGNMLEAVAGPTLSDLNDVATFVSTGEVDRLLQQFRSQPLVSTVERLALGTAGGTALLYDNLLEEDRD